MGDTEYKPRRMTAPEKAELMLQLRSLRGLPEAPESYLVDALRQHLQWEDQMFVPSGGDVDLAKDRAVVFNALAALARVNQKKAELAQAATAALGRILHKLSEGR